MTGQQLRNSILQEAIQGRLVPNVLQPEEKTGAELLQDILAVRQKKENDEQGKKAKRLSLTTIEEEPWELPAGWCWCKLKDIIDFKSSGTTKNGEIAPDSWILDLEDIEKDTGKLLRKKRFGEVKSLSDKRAFKIGDVLYGKLRPYLNKCIIADENGFCTTEILAFDFGHIYNRYAQLFLMSPYFVDRVNQGAAGVKMPRVNNTEANDTCFPVPPLSIQEAIVEMIEELFPFVDEYEKASIELNTLNNLLPDKLSKSVLQEAIHGKMVSNVIPDGEATAPELLQQILKERQDRENKEKGKKAKKLTLSTIDEEPWELPEGWCWCKLGDLFEIVRGGSPRPIKDFITSDDSGYNWIKIGDTDKGGKYITEAKERIIREGLKKTRLVHSGDLLLTNSMSFGRPYILKIDGCIHDGWLVLSPYIKELDKEFMFYLLSTPYVYDVFTVKAAGGVVSNLKTEKVIDTIVPLPPLSIQHRIVEKIEEVFATIDKLQA